MDVDFEGKFVCDLYNSTSTSIILIVLMILFFLPLMQRNVGIFKVDEKNLCGSLSL